MAGCGDLDRNLRDLARRVSDLERCTGCRNGARSPSSGGNNQPFDEETFIKKVLDRFFRHRNWIAVTECLEFIIKGKVGNG